jgi:hypothetical protein
MGSRKDAVRNGKSQLWLIWLVMSLLWRTTTSFAGTDSFLDLSSAPASISVSTETGAVDLQPGARGLLSGNNITVTTQISGRGFGLKLAAPDAAVKILLLQGSDRNLYCVADEAGRDTALAGGDGPRNRSIFSK